MNSIEAIAIRLRNAVTAKMNFDQAYDLLLETLDVEDDAIVELDEVMGMVEDLSEAESAEGVSAADARKLLDRLKKAREWKR